MEGRGVVGGRLGGGGRVRVHAGRLGGRHQDLRDSSASRSRQNSQSRTNDAAIHAFDTDPTIVAAAAAVVVLTTRVHRHTVAS
jgi:hypothetical protein